MEVDFEFKQFFEFVLYIFISQNGPQSIAGFIEVIDYSFPKFFLCGF